MERLNRGTKIKMKCYLYCNKQAPYIYKHLKEKDNKLEIEYVLSDKLLDTTDALINGRIPASFEISSVEKIFSEVDTETTRYRYYLSQYYNSPFDKLIATQDELYKYLGHKGENVPIGYVWYIDNLKKFNYTADVYDFLRGNCTSFKAFKPLMKAPKNIQYAYLGGEEVMILPISSKLLYEILNGKRTIVRKTPPKDYIHYTYQEALERLGWRFDEWVESACDIHSNRWVDFDDKYVDIYTYSWNMQEDYGEKVKAYLTKKEFNLFNNLFKEIENNGNKK